jgi:peptidoglycan/LPS O-acetylase OafA/YrhL
MTLSSYIKGRDNNFNIIRIIAALCVLVTHSFALVIGTGDAEPFIGTLGMTIGSIAVDVFFITSGFLVTASLMVRQGIIEFVLARVLRIFPALLVMVFISVFILGAFFTTLPLSSYFTDPITYSYLAKCSTLVAGVKFNLPGVFYDNPYKSTVNGSLWTMPYEIFMYAILAIVWLTFSVTPKFRLKAFQIIIISYALLSCIYVLASHFYMPSVNRFFKLSFMFFTGSVFYILKERIRLSGLLFWLAVIALVFSTVNKHVFFMVYILSIAYILMYTIYIPSGYIRKYNLLGDYSYGIYIYAFPIQQSVAALIPGVSVITLLCISTVATILLSIISWHYLERRFLGLKDQYVGHTKKWLNFLTQT